MPNSSNIKSFFLSFILIAVLPNVALVALAAWLDLNRPYINLDYLLITLLVFTPLRAIGVIFFVGCFALDLLALTGQIFLFIRPDSLLYLAKFLPEASGIYQLSVAGIVILLLALATLFSVLPRFSKPLHALILFNTAVCIYAINVYSEQDQQERIWRVQHSPIVDSQLLFLLNQRNDGFLLSFDSNGPALSDKKVSGASAEWFNPNRLNATNNKLMLIASESWGIPNNKAIQQALLKPLSSLSGTVKNFSTGQFSFSGPTVAAELRELCQLTPFHYNFKNTITGFEDCLPNQLKHAGYNTHAMHGATGVMYDRIYWYPRAGFHSSTFFETQAWPRRCYSFPGACDVDMIDTANRVLASDEPTFLYWLTLNSHSVYDPRDIVVDVFDCTAYDIPAETQTCRNLKLHAQFFFSLAKAIEQGSFNNVEVIIVGDHAPIITDLEEKARYFVAEQVPWVKFSVANSDTNQLALAGSQQTGSTNELSQ
jgi:hypothetical protein